MKQVLLVSAFLALTVFSKAQIYLGDNGLSTSGSGTSKKVSLGGTLNNAQTAIDFGSGNSGSNFLIKKGTSNYFYIGNDGRLAIGTTSTPEQLVIGGGGAGNEILIGSQIASGYNHICLNGSTNPNDYNFESKNTDKNLWINMPTGQVIVFSNNDVPKMAMTSTGRFGIGQGWDFNSIGYQLDVATPNANDGLNLKKVTGSGFVRMVPNNLDLAKYNALTKAGDGGLFYGTAQQASGTNTTFGFVLAPWHNNAVGIRMDENGNVGINQGTPTAPLDVNGKIKANSLAIINNSSNVATIDSLGKATFKGAIYSGYTNSSQLSDSSFVPRKYVDSVSSNGNNIRNDAFFNSPQNGGINLNGYINLSAADGNTNILNINGATTWNTQNALVNIQENSPNGVSPYKTHSLISFRAPNMQVGDNINIYVGRTFASKQMGYFGYYYGGDTTFGHSAFTFDAYGLSKYPHVFWFDSSYYIGYGLKKTAGIKFGVNGQASFKGAVYAGYTNSSVLTDSSFTPRKYVDSLIGTQSAQTVGAWSMNGNGNVNGTSQFIGTTNGQPLVFKTNGAEAMRIGANGNIGIGTTNITDANFKLIVEGAIHSRKVKVDQDTWSDYVFDNDYQLRTLAEVQKYINTHKHLPGVPSASEVKKNGIDLGENQSVLLKKIEELTLYAIDQNKQLEDQNKKIDSLQQQIDELKRLIKKN